MLITSNHVLNENNIKYRGKIKVSFYNDKIFKEIIIDDDRRIFSDEILDVTFIEINIKKDNIKNFLELDEKINYDKNNLNDIYSSKSIYVINYPKGENIVVSFGFLSQIENDFLIHSCNTEKGSSGSPIISLNTFKVIGIHNSFDKVKEMNRDTFIQFSINNFYKKYNINYGDNNKKNIIDNEKNNECKNNEHIEKLNDSGKKFFY